MSNLTITVVSEYLLDSYCHSGARTGVSKRVLAFDSLCEARTGVAKRVLAFNSLCGGRTGVAKHIIAVTVSAVIEWGLENIYMY